VFHPFNNFCGCLLDSLQQVRVFLDLRAPELDAVFLVGSHQSRVERKKLPDNFLLQVIAEPMRKGVMLKLVLINKEGLLGNVKLKRSLDCWNSGALEQQEGCTPSSLPWSSGEQILACSGICSVEYHGKMFSKEEGPKKAR